MPYFSYMCLVDSISDGKVNFDPAVGCDQGGPTPTQPGKAWDWYIENVLEECDSPGEYYFDSANDLLYYTFNGTEAPTGHEELSLTRTKVIFNISGTMADPVKNIRIQGLTVRDAAFTYLGTTEADRHWLPSEGDWALQRSGAVHIEGAEGVSLHRNQLTRNDGNAVFLGGYTRAVNITNCDFNYIGDSVIALFGWTSDCLWANCSVKLPAKVGPDGRSGEQPRGTNIAGNVIREFGIWQKQSSALFQAIGALTTFESNVVFNGPRAAINYNDPFGALPPTPCCCASRRPAASSDSCPLSPRRWRQHRGRQPAIQPGARDCGSWYSERVGARALLQRPGLHRGSHFQPQAHVRRAAGWCHAGLQAGDSRLQRLCGWALHQDCEQFSAR